MTTVRSAQAGSGTGPTGLHHHAYVCEDQERTRQFYEGTLGLLLTAFWVEDEVILGERHVFSHAFYELPGGGALAFFNFADPEQQARYKAQPQPLFVHLALEVDRARQRDLKDRLENAGHAVWEADHGYTYSVYVTDPDGLLIELSADPPDIEAIRTRQRATARDAGPMGGRAARTEQRRSPRRTKRGECLLMEESLRIAIEAACQRLCYAFCTHGDANDVDRYEALFAPDARFSRPGRVLRSASEIGDALRARPATTIVRHLCMNPQIEVLNETHARGAGICSCFATTPTRASLSQPCAWTTTTNTCASARNGDLPSATSSLRSATPRPR